MSNINFNFNEQNKSVTATLSDKWGNFTTTITCQPEDEKYYSKFIGMDLAVKKLIFASNKAKLQNYKTRLTGMRTMLNALTGSNKPNSAALGIAYRQVNALQNEINALENSIVEFHEKYPLFIENVYKQKDAYNQMYTPEHLEHLRKENS